MKELSGDHAGWSSNSSGRVSTRRPVPSDAISTSSDRGSSRTRSAKTIAVPSGDQAGAVFSFRLVVRAVAAPSETRTTWISDESGNMFWASSSPPANTIRVPSGDQAGSYAATPERASPGAMRFGSPPAASTTWSRKPRRNAIKRPSGDHDGKFPSTSVRTACVAVSTTAILP